MARYFWKRIWQMIPTLLGVMVLTFILFHVVGGSPAALTLGEHVSAQTLEEFDELQGFNRPLFWGRWTRTRALADFRAGETGARLPLRNTQDPAGVPSDGRLRPGLYALDPLFPLPPASRYRIDLRGSFPGDAQAAWVMGEGGEASEVFSPDTPVPAFRRSSISSSASVSLVFDPRAGWPLLRITGGDVQIRSLRLRRGMPRAWDSQFVGYLRQLARLDLGYSRVENRRVSAILAGGIGPTLALTAPILFGGLALALFLSLWCALHRGRWPDRLLVFLSVVLMSVNYVVWIVLGQYVFGFRLGWFPVWGFESWRYLLLPVAIGIVSGLGADLRFYRTVMIEEMSRDYVQTARAKGVGRLRLLFHHVLPNALIPVLAQTASALPFLYTGSLLLESFFGIPGLGYIGVNAVNSADVDVLRAVVLVGALLFMGVNLVTDLAYAAVDPRVTLS